MRRQTYSMIRKILIQIPVNLSPVFWDVTFTQYFLGTLPFTELQ